jgi:hypothetical protein
VTEEARDKTLRLSRKGGRAAILVGSLLLAGAAWAARIDLTSEVERNSVPLDWLGTIYKLTAAAVLWMLGARLRSRSMWLLAALLALMTAGSFVIGTGWFNAVAGKVTGPLSDLVGRSPMFLKLATMFVSLALIAGTLVWMAYRNAAPFERPAVVRLVVLMAAVGFFVGPVNALSTQGISRQLLFAEDFGQVVSLSVLAAYGTGLLVGAGAQSSALARHSQTKEARGLPI